MSGLLAISKEELSAFAQSVVRATVQELKDQNKKVRASEVREMLDISVGTLNNMAEDGRLVPCDRWKKKGVPRWYLYSEVVKLISKK